MNVVSLLVVTLVSFGKGDEWEGVRRRIGEWRLIGGKNWKNFSVSVGDHTGRLFEENIGVNTMQTNLFVASSSKWPVASAIVGVVAEGKLQWSSHPQDFLPFWTKDPNDWRSQMTLHDLLTFTSGFFSGSDAGDVPCLGNFTANFTECIMNIHDHASVAFVPGSTFDYNSYHLQVAGAMACAAVKLDPDAFLQRYLMGRVKMTNSSYTSWGEWTNPQFAATLQTNGADYERFLHSYFTNELLPKKYVNIMETDWTQGKKISNASKFMLTGEGHYSMGNFFECAYNNGSLRENCIKASIHVDPGLFGYYPIIDRGLNYYMQIVYQGMDSNAALAGYNARAFLKPSVDKVIKMLHSSIY